MATKQCPAAMVSVWLSNMIGVVLTPLLVVTLMNTTGGVRVDGSAVGDIALRLLVPFALGQLLRPRIADWVSRHTVLTKAVDRRSILLVVYTAFSVGQTKRPASGLPMALLFGSATVGPIMLPLMIFHQLQPLVCAAIASRLSRQPVA